MTKLDFSILQDLNVSRMLFLDTSDYTTSPISPIVHIKFPDFNKEYSSVIQFGEINILNTARLKYTDCITDFPDGVYNITYEVDNKRCEISKKIFRTTKAWKMLDDVLSIHNWSDNKDLLEKFNKINLYLRGAESVVSINEQQSIHLYKEAINQLNCYNINDVRLLKKQCSCSK